MDIQQASSSKNTRASLLLYAVVLYSGAAVMMYEFLAVRILNRFFGSSIFVWAAVINVLLAGLCIGYALGGVMADRFGSFRSLGIPLLFAGITAAFTEVIAIFIGDWLLTVEHALVLHPYIAAFCTSFLPILALGTVLPQAIRLQANRTERVGGSAGWMSALSTAGSILGVLLTVYLLIPRLGLRESIYWISGLLAVLGMLLIVLPRKMGLLKAAMVLLLLTPGSASAEILFEEYTNYHHIVVEDRAKVRLLRFDDAVQSVMYKYAPDKDGFEYTEFFHVPVVLDPTINSALFIGLGGGTGPKSFLKDYPKMEIEVVEIDQRVVDVARKYFMLPEDPRMEIHVRDGRIHLQRSKKIYGTIIVDAYSSGPYGAFLPHHLATKEFFELTWKHLEHGGSLVYNIASEEQEDTRKLARTLYATMHGVFQTVYAFDVKSSYNMILVAQKIDPDQPEAASGEKKVWPGAPWLKHPLTEEKIATLTDQLLRSSVLHQPQLPQRVRQFSSLQGSAPGETIYTDNFAPVDVGPGGRGAHRYRE